MSATTQPTPEQVQRAAWDLMLLDIETRTEQLRQLKATPTRTVVIQLISSAVTAGIAVVAAISGGTIWLLHAIGWLH